MKLKKSIFTERNKIVNNKTATSFSAMLRHTPLIPSDLADHKLQLEKVYKGMLREACVIDDCCERFRRMIRWN